MGLTGHAYGAEGISGADIEPSAPTHMWDAFQWRSAAGMQYLRTFAFSIGRRYQDLVPIADLVTPNKTSVIPGYLGWAYCARTGDIEIVLAYFERECPQSQIRGAKLSSVYRAQWFNLRNGTWLNVDDGTLVSNRIGIIMLPKFPDDEDWGLRLSVRDLLSGNSRDIIVRVWSSPR